MENNAHSNIISNTNYDIALTNAGAISSTTTNNPSLVSSTGIICPPHQPPPPPLPPVSYEVTLPPNNPSDSEYVIASTSGTYFTNNNNRPCILQWCSGESDHVHIERSLNGIFQQIINTRQKIQETEMSLKQLNKLSGELKKLYTANRNLYKLHFNNNI